MSEQLDIITIDFLDYNSNDLLNNAIFFARNTHSKSCEIIHLLLTAINMGYLNDFVHDNNIDPEFTSKSAIHKLQDEDLLGIIDESLCENGKCTVESIDYLGDSITDFIFCELKAKHVVSKNSVVKLETLLYELVKYARDDVNVDDWCTYFGICDSGSKLIVSTPKDAVNIEPLVIPKEFRAFIHDLMVDDTIAKETIFGVDQYITKAFEVLSRKVKANPCIIGPAGVGKTAIVHGIVKKILNGEAPKQFSQHHIVSIDAATISAGIRYRGDFEERLSKILDWAQEQKIILFIDEVHAFVTAGADRENSESSNALKPVLSNGNVRVIGATTLKEYHRVIEQDTALERRLQVIEVKEPTKEVTQQIIENAICDYEDYHGVKVDKDIITSAIELTHKYMKDKSFPDKAFTVIDEACAKTKLAKEKVVSRETLLNVISENSGIDVRKLDDNQTEKLIKLESIVGKRVIGQKNAISRVCRAIRRSKAGTHENDKPIATMLFVGPTGVGKTELSKVISDNIVPSKEAFIKIDMSEYSEKGSITRLIGASPSFVGYGEGGQLTEAVKHNPYALLLFDEIEKACDEVYNLMLQLLDEGRLTDGQGDTVDFTNCIIIMTSNTGYGAEELNRKTVGFNSDAKSEKYDDAEKDAKVRKALEQTFKPEFINRFDDIVIFDKLDKTQCERIVELMLDKLSERIDNNAKISITFSDSLVKHIADVGFSDKYGARNLRRSIQDIVEDDVSMFILDGTMKRGETYIVDYDNDSDKLVVT